MVSTKQCKRCAARHWTLSKEVTDPTHLYCCNIVWVVQDYNPLKCFCKSTENGRCSGHARWQMAISPSWSSPAMTPPGIGTNVSCISVFRELCSPEPNKKHAWALQHFPWMHRNHVRSCHWCCDPAETTGTQWPPTCQSFLRDWYWDHISPQSSGGRSLNIQPALRWEQESWGWHLHFQLLMECCLEMTSNQFSLTQLMQKPSFMPVTRHSIHSCVRCDCSAAAYASATNGIEIGAAINIGDTAAGAPQCSTLSHWVWPGVGPPWYTQISVMLAQYLSMGTNACWTGHLA